MLKRSCCYLLWPLTAVILGVIVGAKLETVVGAADEVTLAASVAVIVTAVTRTITITLTLVTGVLRSAASPASFKVPAETSLVGRRVEGYPGSDDRGRSLHCQAVGQVTAVVFGMIVQPELPAVVTPTHQVSPAPLVTVVLSTVQGTVTVSLTKPARIVRSTTSPSLVIPAATSLP